MPLLNGKPFRQTCTIPLQGIVFTFQCFVDDRDQLSRGVESGCYIKGILAEYLLNSSSHYFRRIPVHHPEYNSMLAYSCGFTNYLHGITIVFERSNESDYIERIVFERHVM